CHCTVYGNGHRYRSVPVHQYHASYDEDCGVSAGKRDSVFRYRGAGVLPEDVCSESADGKNADGKHYVDGGKMYRRNRASERDEILRSDSGGYGWDRQPAPQYGGG